MDASITTATILVLCLFLVIAVYILGVEVGKGYTAATTQQRNSQIGGDQAWSLLTAEKQ